MRAAYLFLLFLPGLLAQGQYDLDPLPPFPDHVQYTHYSDQIDNPDYYDYQEVTPRPPAEQFQFQSQQQVQQEVIAAPTIAPGNVETEPTEPGPLDCREEQYPCTRLYSIHKPCKQCLNEVCFYSLRRVYVVNKEICVRTVCAHEELLRGWRRGQWFSVTRPHPDPSSLPPPQLTCVGTSSPNVVSWPAVGCVNPWRPPVPGAAGAARAELVPPHPPPPPWTFLGSGALRPCLTWCFSPQPDNPFIL
ncbi:microfibrillar-associated protein 2 isoform X2 [Leptonychotes weddellii]|uniref:Microfibrillar-associated protein 2 isoform X2 n=1 Tax=Leptonychotes weddellii TaxID=9713 RepID=A0A7F8R698_LEPWE|nr:microfibrillar-associated protein 2 isoform X2 [Leptonychotes weddellii]